MALYREGRIKPAVTERFPLARGAEAIAALGARRGARQSGGGRWTNAAVDLKYTAEEEAFRAEVRAFLEAELPADIRSRMQPGQAHSSRTTWCAGKRSCTPTAGAP